MADDSASQASQNKKEAVEAKEDKKIEVPEKFKGIVEEIEKMSVLDLAELVTILEDKFGVSAAAPVAAVAAAPGADGEEAGEEQTEFNVQISDFGDKKVPVIKAVKELTGKGLKEAKELVEKKGVVMEGVPKDKADEAKKKLEEAGGKVEIK